MENARRNLWIALAAALVIAAVALAKPVYRGIRSWRADSLAVAAEAAIGRQAWTEASQKAQAAYHLDPTNPRSMRVVAQLYTIAGQPNAVVFWQNLADSGKATMEDRRELIRAGLRFGKSIEVRPEVFKLASEKPLQPANLRVAAEFCLLTGDRTNALRFSRELLQIEPGPSSELLLSQALLVTRGPAEQAQARAMLQRLAALTNSTGLEAQVVLAQSGLLADEALPALIDRLSKHPSRQLPHRLLTEELRLRLKPQHRAATVAAFVAEYANAAITNRLEIARWLNRQREFGRAIELLPADEALKNRDAFLARIDALAALGKWKEARGELQSESVPVEPVLRELYLARTAGQLNLLPEAEAHWRRVHLELATKPEAVLYVAEYAEKIGEIDEARKAWERLVSVPEFSDRAFAGMIRIAEQTGGTRTLREIMRDLSARRPDDPAPQNDFAYLNLLLNERLESSKEIAKKLHEAHPNVMAYRTTLALAYLRLDDRAAARKVYEGLNLDWRVLQPGWQAVHAAVVGASGEPHLARTLARQIPLAGLKPEERALVQPWL